MTNLQKPELPKQDWAQKTIFREGEKPKRRGRTAKKPEEK